MATNEQTSSEEQRTAEESTGWGCSPRFEAKQQRGSQTRGEDAPSGCAGGQTTGFPASMEAFFAEVGCGEMAGGMKAMMTKCQEMFAAKCGEHAAPGADEPPAADGEQ